MKNRKQKIEVEIPEGQQIDCVFYGGYHSYQQEIIVQFKPIKKHNSISALRTKECLDID